MTNNHPITPPQELVQEWHYNWKQLSREKLVDFPEYIATQAARWGADIELEACCEWLCVVDRWKTVADRMRDARRPKPPSLKEQALEALDRMDQLPTAEDHGVIRRALEALDD